jgi:hypothetical protein
MLTAVLTFMADITITSAAWTNAGLGAAIAVIAAVAFTRLRGTTLAAAAVWAFLAAFAIAAVEVLIALQGDGPLPRGAGLWRYCAAAGAFCPLMAVLGAKRPQDRGWQWVVGALWVVLLVPPLQIIAARAGSELELYGVWRMLLATLIAMGVLNYLPTRFGLPAVVFAAGQSVLWGPFLFGVEDAPWTQCVGLGLMLLAAATASAMGRRRKADGGTPRDPGAHAAERSGPFLNELSLRWLRFRDAWGAFWALRIMQRVNQTAELSGWPVRLDWSRGFVATEEAAQPEQQHANDDAPTLQIQQSLDTLLRRFERL